jgi:hypothetical protein
MESANYWEYKAKVSVKLPILNRNTDKVNVKRKHVVRSIFYLEVRACDKGNPL